MAKKEQSDERVKEQLEARLAEIELHRQRAQEQGLAFAALPREELERKIRGETSNSPYLYSAGWTSGTSPGYPASYIAGVSNPDATGYYPVFVTVFFGAANFFLGVADGVISRDTRWPYMCSEPLGLTPNGGSALATLSYTTPSYVPLGTYTGNAVVWAGDYFGAGTFFQRGMFWVTLT